MKNGTNGSLSSLLRKVWFPILAFTLLAIPIAGMWELLRPDRPAGVSYRISTKCGSNSSIRMSPPMSKEASLALFRLLQEALQNAVKHSHAQDFKVELRGTPDEIHLTVSDSGAGFDQREALGSRGLGLVSMRERLQLVNGTMAIESEPGGGTTIRARVPIDVASAQPKRMTG